MSQHSQLALPLPLDRHATFENYYVREADGALSALVHDNPSIFVWGGAGLGKSHLLQAVCHDLEGSCFLPMEEVIDMPPEALLDGLERASLVAFDNLDLIEGRDNWQEPLFSLFNLSKESGTPWLVSAGKSPAGFENVLPDLRSRLSSLAVFHLAPWSDDELVALLIFRAAKRGLTLAEDVARYIVNRAERSTVALIALLDRLDQAALEQSRGVTIPLVKELGVLP